MTFVIVPDHEKWLVVGVKQRPSSVSVDHDLVNLKFKRINSNFFFFFLFSVFATFSLCILDESILSNPG